MYVIPLPSSCDVGWLSSYVVALPQKIHCIALKIDFNKEEAIESL